MLEFMTTEHLLRELDRRFKEQPLEKLKFQMAERVDPGPEELVCLLCGEGGFKNLIGHVYSKHRMNSAQYKEETGYDGPMIDPHHARFMAIKSNALWDDPVVRQNRVDGIVESYQDEERALREERRITTSHDWAIQGSKKRNAFSKLRDDLNERAGFKCEDCGVSEELHFEKTGRCLDLHHLNYDKYLPTLDDVQLLCQTCHHKFHSVNQTRDQQFPKIAKAVGNLLTSLKVDLKDENYIETPARSAAFLQTHFISRDEFEENIEGFKKSVFPSEYNNMIIQFPIMAYGMCPHHLLPVIYKVAIGYIPEEHTIGLSKISRIAQLCMKPPMLQETATTFLADALQDILRTKHVAVVVGGKHLCMIVRGIKDPNTVTMTSTMRGAFMEEASTRSEFYALSHARESILNWAWA